MIRFLVTDTTNPAHNLALEESLFSNGKDFYFYLWQNDRTIVIGRNQNAWAECKVEEFERAGGNLVRRSTGGGAVYHDLGNLNFSFVCNEEDFDLDRQFGVIKNALRSLGVNAETSGRNDLTVDGKKMSGNAFRHSRGRALHHGTLLVDSDMNELSKYLNVSKEKLESKGIKSVRSRVINLCEVVPTITVAGLKTALKEAFIAEYGDVEENFELDDFSEIEQTFASREFRLGENPSFKTEWNARFPWGGVQVLTDVKNNVIRDVKVFSDCNDVNLPSVVEDALLGADYSTDAMVCALDKASGKISEDALADIKANIKA